MIQIRLYSVIVMVTILYQLIFYGGQDAKNRTNFPDEGQNHRLLLFIIDLDLFMCHSCLISFHEFCDNLSSPVLRSMIWGIIRTQNDHKLEARRIKIIMKKIRGFKKTHDIMFPIVIAHSSVCDDLSREGTAIILLDQKKKIAKKYTFPLNKREIDEILNTLTK